MRTGWAACSRQRGPTSISLADGDVDCREDWLHAADPERLGEERPRSIVADARATRQRWPESEGSRRGRTTNCAGRTRSLARRRCRSRHLNQWPAVIDFSIAEPDRRLKRLWVSLMRTGMPTGLCHRGAIGGSRTTKAVLQRAPDRPVHPTLDHLAERADPAH